MTAKNIHQRLAEVMGKVSYIQKERKQGMKYTIVSHDKVTALLRPVFLECGIVYYPVRCAHSHNGNRAECGMTVRFVNIDKPDDFFDVETFGYGVDTQDKGPGKAMSYAVKYALLKATGLETGDDPDHENIEHTRDDPANKPSQHEVETAIEQINRAASLEALQKEWGAIYSNLRHVADDPRVIKAKDIRKDNLTRDLTNQGAG